MSHTYHSLVGIINLVFTAAIVALVVKFWNTSPDFVQVLLLIGLVFFPIIQPIMVYIKCKNQVRAIPSELEMDIDDSGLLIYVGEKQERISWKRVKGLILERNMVILRVDEQNGYFLPNHTLRKEREELVSFIKDHISK